MPAGDWVITIAGALLALAGLALLAWSLLSDRLRTRRLRRQGALRRCPRCWYEMSAVAGLRCPECGREAKRERSLHSSRRRWRVALMGSLVLASGAACILYPQSAGGAWKRWLPDTALILLIPHTTDTGWAADEMARRLGMWGTAPAVSTGQELSRWQQRLLTSACAQAVERAETFPARPMAWWLLMCSSPDPESAIGALLGELESEDPKLRLWAALCLDRTRFFLSEEQLVQAKEAILAAPPIPREFDEELRLGHAAAIDRQLRSRNAETYASRIGAIAAMPITPEALVGALHGQSINELIALHRRLGVRRTSLYDADELATDAIRAERIELRLNQDQTPDSIVLVWNSLWDLRGSGVHYEAFIVLSDGQGWRFAGTLDLSNTPASPPTFRVVSAEDGQRWLVVQEDAGSSPDGSYFIMQDAWYSVKRGRLVLEQTVMPRGYAADPLERTLEHDEPRIIRRGRRSFAAYDITSTLGLPVTGESGTKRTIPVAEERGRFEYPLGVPDAKLGQHVPPGPWSGRDCWWMILDDQADLIAEYKPELLALARSDDPEIRAALRAVTDQYLTFLAPTPDITEIQQALDEP